jgi:predicted outer membrane protein
MKAFGVASILFCGAAMLPGSPAGGVSTMAGDEDGQFVLRAVAISLQQTSDADAAARGTRRSEIVNAARSIARDHSRKKRQLTSLAAQKGLVLPELAAQPPDPGASDPDRVARLLKGGEEAVAVFHQEAVRGTDPDLQRFAQTSLTALQQKVTVLRSLQEAFPAAPLPAPRTDRFPIASFLGGVPPLHSAVGEVIIWVSEDSCTRVSFLPMSSTAV